MTTKRPLLPSTLRPLFLLTTLLLVLLLPNKTSSCTTTNNTETEFITKTCETTGYPKVCSTSLSPYAGFIHQDSTKLTRAAIRVALSKATATARYFSKYKKRVKHEKIVKPRVVSALKDCVTMFKFEAKYLRSSLHRMQHLVAPSDERFKSQIDDIWAWLSGMSMNEFICTQGFDENDRIPDEPVKSDVHNHVQKVNELSSIALDLFTSTFGLVT